MKVKIYPGIANGEISAPSSKSLLHRLLICASLANEKCELHNTMVNDDVLATISCLNKLGAEIVVLDNKILIKKGIVFKKNYEEVVINANESASTLRFLIPLSSYLSKRVVFVGKKSLLKRPNDIYRYLYEKESKKFKILEDKIVIEGELNENEYLIDGTVSSQFISGLLFYLPLRKTDSKIIINGFLQSKPYVLLTIMVLKEFGVNIDYTDEVIMIKGNQTYKCKRSVFNVEGDYSQAANFLCLGALNGNVMVRNLDEKSLQGDKKIIDFLKQMGANIVKKDDGYLTGKGNTLINCTFDLIDNPDLVPILLVCLSTITNKSVIKNVKRLKYKESDRIFSMKEELDKFGIYFEYLVEKDEIVIQGKSELIVEEDIELSSHNDHRIFMALSILATLIKGSGKIIINNSECLNKSYPKFLSDLKSLGIKVEKVN